MRTIKNSNDLFMKSLEVMKDEDQIMQVSEEVNGDFKVIKLRKFSELRKKLLDKPGAKERMAEAIKDLEEELTDYRNRQLYYVIMAVLFSGYLFIHCLHLCGL